MVKTGWRKSRDVIDKDRSWGLSGEAQLESSRAAIASASSYAAGTGQGPVTRYDIKEFLVAIPRTYLALIR